MNVKIYADEVSISAEDSEEIGMLNDLFNNNHTAKQHISKSYTAKVMVTKSEGNHFTISFSFV